MRDHLNLAITSVGDRDIIAQVASASLNLDAIVQELLESRKIEDFVRDGLLAVDDVLGRVSAADRESRPISVPLR